MERFVKNFWTEEDGNTTLDWMVLTAGLVLLGAAVMASVGVETQTVADDASGVAVQTDQNIGV